MVESLVALFFSFLLSSLIFTDRSQLFLMRTIGLALAVAIPFWFNFNWLLGKSFSAAILAALFFVLWLFFFLRRKKSSKEIRSIQKMQFKKKWVWIVFMLSILAIIVTARFEGKFDVPNYETSDGAIHFLYLSQTAKTGLMPQFLPSAIYPASGFADVYKVHHLSYFPGVTVAFSWLDWLFKFNQSLAELQIFNGILYSLIVMYLFWMAFEAKIIYSKIGYVSLGTLLFLGVLFDFVITSHTTQLFGLFMLIFFVDMVALWKKNAVEPWLPMLALASLVLSYFYWLPVALIYLGIFFLPPFIEKKGIANIKDLFLLLIEPSLIFIGSLILSVGYIKITYSIGVLGAATANGAFAYKNYFLDDVILALPFAFAGLYLFWKKNKYKKEEMALFVFCIAGFLYAGLLYIAYRWFGKVSDYVRMKSLFLVLPMAWIFVVYFFERLVIFLRNQKELFSLANIKKLFSRYKIFIIALLIFTAVVVFIGGQPFAVEIMNTKLLIDGPKTIDNEKNSISKDQIMLLNELNDKYAFALRDGRIMTIAPPGVDYWVFAYAGIWPLTDTLLATTGAMDPWSSFDYEQWLKNDREHYILYLDSKSSQGWATTYGFKLSDYQIIAKIGKNYLLQLTKDRATTYLKISEGEKKIKMKSSVSSGSFIGSDDSLAGVGIIFNEKILKKGETYNVNLYGDDCGKSGNLLDEYSLNGDDIIKLKPDSYYYFKFDKPIFSSDGKSFCVKTFTSENMQEIDIMNAKEDGTAPIRKMYLYNN